MVAEPARSAALRLAPPSCISTESAATNFIISTHVERADSRIWTERGRPYHRFRPEMKALIIKLYKHDYKIHNLAEAFNCSTATIQKTLKKAGVNVQYSRRMTLVGSDNELKYRLDPYDIKIVEDDTWTKKAKKVRNKVKIWFNRSTTRRQQLQRILYAFSCWLVYLIDHTFDGDWLDLVAKGEKPP